MIYDTTSKDIIQSAMDGVNGTIFAYGQTSSGKTFTMRGTKECPGIIPLAVKDVFKFIEMNPEREFVLRCSFMEIYNEEIRDLLASAVSTSSSSIAALNKQKKKLRIYDDPQRGVFVDGLKEEIVTSYEQVLHWFNAGDACRAVGQTGMNNESSRSHSIFRLVIESRSKSEAASIAAAQAQQRRSTTTGSRSRQGVNALQGGSVKIAQLVPSPTSFFFERNQTLIPSFCIELGGSRWF